MRIVAGFFGALILIAAVAAIVGSEMIGPEIRIDQETTQKAVNERLPFEGRVVGMTYKVDEVEVDFREDGRFALQAQVAVEARGRDAKALANLSSGLTYKRNSGTFYLEDVAIDNVEWLALTPKESDKTIFSKAISGLQKIGIGEGQVESLMASFEAPLKKSLKSMTEDTLASVRVYSLGDSLKGKLIARAVSEVSVEKGELVVSLSWADVFTRVCVYLVMAFLALVISFYLLRSAFRSNRGGDGAFTVIAEGVGAIGGAFLD